MRFPCKIIIYYGYLCGFVAGERLGITSKILFLLLILGYGVSASSIEKLVSIDFDPVTDASFYQIEVSNNNGEIKTHDLKTTHVELSLPVGVYKVRIRSFDARKVPGPWGESFEVLAAGPPPELQTPSANEKIKSNDLNKTSVTFKWSKQELATHYIIILEPSKIQKQLSDTEIKMDLPVSQKYQWRIVSYKEKEPLYDEPVIWREFTIYGKPLDAPVISELKTKYDEIIRWTKPKLTDAFHLKIERSSDNEKWVKVLENDHYTEAQFYFPKKFLGGNYRFAIKAKGELRQDSPWAEYQFYLAGGARGPVAAKKAELRDSLELPTSNYLIASYLISNINYSGTNMETSSQSVYSALGGTGRIGAGHFGQNSKFGYFGILDLSGYNIGQQNFSYASSEFHYCYRTYLSTVQLRTSVGIYLKEVPETKGEADGSFTMNKISTLGPHFGFDYWKPLTAKYGVQWNGRLYYSAMATQTPNSRPIASRLSYQVGVLGSYRLTKNLLAFAGYAYRMDETAYKSTPGTQDPDFTSVATEGDVNKVTLNGHFLNVQFEWGF